MFEPSVWRKKDPSQLWCKDCKEHRTCRGSCGLEKVQWEFSPSEWKEAGKFRSVRGKCKACMKSFRQMKPCAKCHQAFPNDRSFYSEKMWERRDDQRKCNECSQAPCDVKVPTKQCSKCHKELTQTFFSEKQWFRVAERNIKCTGCCIGPQSPQKLGLWTCRAPGCHFTGDKEMFRHWRDRQKVDKANGREKCNACFLALDAATQDLAIRRRDVKRNTVISKTTP